MPNVVACMQVEQEKSQAWQQFCAASVVVTPAGPGAPAAGNLQGQQGDLYQHRLPQLGSRMQQLLTQAGAAWHASTQGIMYSVTQTFGLTLYS